MPASPSVPSSNPATERITVLTSMNGRACAKRWHRDAAGQVACEQYGHESHWAVSEAVIPDFDAFAACLGARARDTRCIIIRGGLRDPLATMPDDGWIRRIHGEGAPFVAVPRRWVALDFDGAIAPREIASGAPMGVVGWLTNQLPAEWHGVSCVWQFTSSHGMEGNPQSLRVRLWFLADAPMTDVAWRAYWSGRVPGLNLDLSLFRCVQPHYICSPSFEGVADPVGPDRIGVYLGDNGDYVPISAVVPEAQRDLQPVGGTVCEEIPAGLANRQQIESALERLQRQQTTGARHHHLVGACCELVSIGCTLDVAAPTLEDLIRRQGREPAQNEIRGAWQHAVTRAAQGTLVSDVVPVAAMFPPLAPAVLPAHPEIEVVPSADGNDLSIEAAEWSANDHLNARLYLRRWHPNDTLVRSGQINYEWHEGFWRKLESDEVLLARVIRFTGMKHSRCSSTASSLQGLITREHLTAPCWIRNGADASQVVVFKNGILDVPRWVQSPEDPQTFRPLTPDLFVHTQAPYEYDPSATCPTFDRFLDEAFPADHTAKRELLKMLGYLMTPDTRHQKMFILGGIRGSGKSTLTGVLRQLVGPGACTSPSLTSLSNDHGAEPLIGKTVALIAEANNGGDMKSVPMASVDLIKRITGCDEIQINPKYKSSRDITLPLRFVFSCNRLPHFPDPSGAIARRIQLFWFRQSFVGREDISMPARLTAELPGIANRALQGLKWLMEDGGFKPVQSSVEVMRQYVRQISPVQAFVDDCLEPDLVGTVKRQDLYGAYKAWCAQGGRMPLGIDRLVAELIDSQPSLCEARPTIAGLRVRVVSGVKLSAEGVAMMAGSAGL